MRAHDYCQPFTGYLIKGLQIAATEPMCMGSRKKEIVRRHIGRECESTGEPGEKARSSHPDLFHRNLKTMKSNSPAQCKRKRFAAFLE